MKGDPISTLCGRFAEDAAAGKPWDKERLEAEIRKVFVNDQRARKRIGSIFGNAPWCSSCKKRIEACPHCGETHGLSQEILP